MEDVVPGNEAVHMAYEILDEACERLRSMRDCCDHLGGFSIGPQVPPHILAALRIDFDALEKLLVLSKHYLCLSE
jgi:hypothetical protein